MMPFIQKLYKRIESVMMKGLSLPDSLSTTIVTCNNHRHMTLKMTPCSPNESKTH